MTDEQLGALFEAFTNYYWTVPVTYASERIITWHPEVTPEQIAQVLDRCDKNMFWHHCCVEVNDAGEPEIVVEHLVSFGNEPLREFWASRYDIPYCDCDEDTLYEFMHVPGTIPEVKAIHDFVQAEFQLGSNWADELIRHTIFVQPSSLCDGQSWVMGVLGQAKYGKIDFKTVEQVDRFRKLGNELYQVYPNPVIRGWKPKDLENAPALPDNIPEKDEDIPNGKEYDKAIQDMLSMFNMSQTKSIKSKKKIGRNDPCPCGSGKKYKKCCGR